jgi:hypothetical protein
VFGPCFPQILKIGFNYNSHVYLSIPFSQPLLFNFLDVSHIFRRIPRHSASARQVDLVEPVLLQLPPGVIEPQVMVIYWGYEIVEWELSFLGMIVSIFLGS